MVTLATAEIKSKLKKQITVLKTLQQNAIRRELVIAAKNGNKKALNQYHQMNLGLMEQIVRRYIRWVKPSEHNDLRQEAFIGLMKGVQAFDPEKMKSQRPEGYIYSWVRAFVANFARSHGKANSKECVSLHDPIHDDASDCQMDTLVDDRPDAHTLVQHQQVDAWFERLVGRMPSRERAIVYRRMYCNEPDTLADIGEDIGLSRERVRQVENLVRERLKRILEEEPEAVEILK